MEIIKMLFFPTQTPILKAVAAPASNGMGIFKRRQKAPFNPKITLGGFNY
ncbi:hypothetical protein [Mucilaginibacter ginsenosidivorans]|nr:hypothetical protein [Mucilaginibacter ginsenosidivorans]